MGCLCYTKRLASSPYADLLAESQWSAIAQEFVRQCCGLMGLVRSLHRAVPPPDCQSCCACRLLLLIHCAVLLVCYLRAGTTGQDGQQVGSASLHLL
jgi:CTLH/CRA C-terminal to LisH motif domain